MRGRPTSGRAEKGAGVSDAASFGGSALDSSELVGRPSSFPSSSPPPAPPRLCLRASAVVGSLLSSASPSSSSPEEEDDDVYPTRPMILTSDDVAVLSFSAFAFFPLLA